MTKKKRKSDVHIPGQPYTKQYNLIVSRDGVWELADGDEKSIIDELSSDSDRAVAIIAGSMIETRLATSILCRTRRDPIIEDRLFQPSGPLGSFTTKIDLAYPVSYTHLRAHETRHDLVCRLLLEKKK